MKQHWVYLQLTFEAPKNFNLAMTSRRAALIGNASLIATFSSCRWNDALPYVTLVLILWTLYC